MSTETPGPAGPVDIAVLGFEGPVPADAVMAAVGNAVTAGHVRVLDALVVEVGADGQVDYIDVDTEEEALEVLGFPAAVPGLLGLEDAEVIAGQLAPGTSAVMIVWENTWAAEIAGAVSDAGGVLIAQERISRDDIRAVLDTFA
jgi:hypothetical protein